MAENRCTADEAFEMLRMISQNRNIKLHDIAGQIIAAVSGHPRVVDAAVYVTTRGEEHVGAHD